MSLKLFVHWQRSIAGLYIVSVAPAQANIECVVNQVQFSSVQSLSRVRLFATPWTAARPPYQSPTPGVHPDSCPLSW